MNRFALLSTALATALAAMPAPMPAEAATDGMLLRCRSPDGTIGYTDRSCAVFGAQAVPIDAELVARIVSDRRYSARLKADAAGADPQFDMDSATLVQGASGTDAGEQRYAAAAPGRRSPIAGCARNPAQLATDLQASVAMGDVNRIAESYHFAGMSTDDGERVLDRLQRYAGQPVAASHYYGASIGVASTVDGAIAFAGNDAPGMVQLVLGGEDGAATAVDFDVERYQGCYFVSFA
ncbi:MAG: hypothetical protein ACTHOC_06205 [Luteimonas sp.]